MAQPILVSMGATPGIDTRTIFKWVGVPALTVAALVMFKRFRAKRRGKRKAAKK